MIFRKALRAMARRHAARKAEAERDAISKAGQDLYRHRLANEEARRAAKLRELSEGLGWGPDGWRSRARRS